MEEQKIAGTWSFQIAEESCDVETVPIFVVYRADDEEQKEVIILYQNSTIDGDLYRLAKPRPKAGELKQLARVLKAVINPATGSFESEQDFTEWQSRLVKYKDSADAFLIWQKQAEYIRKLDQELREGQYRRLAKPLLLCVLALKRVPPVIAFDILKVNLSALRKTVNALYN
jgi:hypothetical protein